jgi:hypothetical protein
MDYGGETAITVLLGNHPGFLYVSQPKGIKIIVLFCIILLLSLISEI